MTLAHEAHAAGSDVTATLLPLAAVSVLAAGYLLLAIRCRREARGWSGWRTTSFLTGCTLLAVAAVPLLSPFPHEDFRGHMLQHLLVGMYAPLCLVLGAPITLLLRCLPARHGRIVGRVLRSHLVHLVANPGIALALNLGGLAVLYFTPLYQATTSNAVLHHVVHVHLLAAGYLFAWVIAGPDPAPHRPTVPTRLTVLGIAITGHAVLSQLLYAGIFVQVPSSDEVRAGSTLMYYAGDIAELLLALALVTAWRPSHNRSSRKFSLTQMS